MLRAGYAGPTSQELCRGAENQAAMDVLLQHIKWRLGPKLSPRVPAASLVAA